MSLDTLGSHIDEQPKLWASTEEITKAKSSAEHSQKLTKVNNVLQVLDFPDNQEEISRNILSKQDNQTLIELASKSKEEILGFLYKEKKKELSQVKTVENEKQAEEYNERNRKYQDIKNILPNSVFDSGNAEFKNLRENLDRFEALQTGEDATKNTKINEQKAEILETIIAELKNPKVLPAIIRELGWANKNNPKYAEFKNTLIGIDSSFLPILTDLENINSWVSFDTSDIINDIETNSGGSIDIDMTGDKVISKMSLIGSDYSSDKEIDKKALDEVMGDNIDKIEKVQNSYAVLQGVYTPFDGLLNNIGQAWGKPNFEENLNSVISTFPKDIFGDLDETYEDMAVSSDIQVTESDINRLADIDSPDDLRNKVETIKEKFTKINTQIENVKDMVVKKYHAEFKELLQRDTEAKEKELEMLKFMRTSGFDLMPKEITDRLIRDVQSNMLTIPGLNLSRKNIDLKNGNFGESSAFIDKEAWLNIEAKANMLKFMNKVISWDINEPLWVEAIANGTSTANPAFLKNKFLEVGVANSMGWSYGRVVENLKKEL